MLGGKGANQAVALAQLGLHPAVVAVAGDDGVGARLIEQAERDGIDVSAVTRRRGSVTALMADIVDHQGRWRYLEDAPEAVQLIEGDLAAAGGMLADAAWASIQLQPPPQVALAAAAAARRAGCSVVLDGAPAQGRHRDELLAVADVVRADGGRRGCSPRPASRTRVTPPRQRLRSAHGPGLVALTVEDGNYFAWRDGELLVPLSKTPVADTRPARVTLSRRR
jgi:ribokinase